MKIVLLGAAGQLGQQLQRSLAPLGELVALTRHGLAGPSAPAQPLLCGDLGQAQALAGTLRALRPDVIVNAAAYTDVERAETEPGAAHRINGQACALLAEQAQALGAVLLHFSSDYVFGHGSERPWRETDACLPLNHYGLSKLEGERAIAQHCSRYWIVRSSWLYEAGSRNFLSTVLAAALAGTPLRITSDQCGAPTRAAWLAQVAAQILAAPHALPAGLYHASASGHTTWHGYALFALAQAQSLGAALPLLPAQIEPITAQARGGARRPANSRLDTTLLQARLHITPPPWQRGVQDVVRQWVRDLHAARV
ncbi:MAG: dTDP-4-dehydrorhamnose reductase [Burkholderiaceae bacterium]